MISPSGASIFTTSAPRSASNRVQCGPAIVVVKSRTRTRCRTSVSMSVAGPAPGLLSIQAAASAVKAVAPPARAGRWPVASGRAVRYAHARRTGDGHPLERSRAMKVIRVSAYGGPEVLKLEEVPTPKAGPGQVLVRNHAVGVNPVDTYLRSNTDNRGPKLPYTPGSDAAGVVEAVGPDVTGVKAGDRVYVGGTATGA